MMFENEPRARKYPICCACHPGTDENEGDAGSRGATTVDAILDSLRLSARMGWSSMAEQKRNRRATDSLFQDLGWRDSVSLAARVGGLFAQAGVHIGVTTTHSSGMVEY
jgi:hypothetical protein